jgi:hypothetical protein
MRLDVDHRGAEVLQGGAGFEVAVGGGVRYGGLGSAMLVHRGSWARRLTTGAPLFAVRLRRRCLVPEEHFYIARPP